MTVNTSPPRRWYLRHLPMGSRREQVAYWLWLHAQWLYALRCALRRRHRVKFGSHGVCIDCGRTP